MPVLAPYIEPLDMVTMLMGDYKSGDVVCREAKLRHAFKCLEAGQAVVDHDEPLRPLDECAVAF